MGIISNAKEHLSRKMTASALKVADGISTLSSLSPKQVQDLEEKRSKYLAAVPDMNGDATTAYIQNNLGAIGVEVYQAYLGQLNNLYSPVSLDMESFDDENRIRYFDITKWVTDVEEKSLDKLVNVYHVLSEEECNIALIYHRTKLSCKVTIGIANTDERNSDPAIADKYYSRVVGAIKGNFPGAEIQGINARERDYGVGIPECLCNIDKGYISKVKSISTVSNVASEKSEAFISQSMEKLLDGIVPSNEQEEYSVVLLAKPIREQLEVKNRFYELYSALAPYASWQTGYTYTESDGVSSSANGGINLGLSAGAHAGFPGKKESEGKPAGPGIGANASANFGINFSRTSSVTANIGKNESLTQSYVNFGVKHTLEVIESQVKRIEESSALGMWDFAAYVISESPVVANNVAHMYLALTQGEDSYLTKAAVNFWDGDINADEAKIILNSVQKLQHPLFGLKTSLEDEWLMYPTLVTPTTSLSGKELAKALNFPRKSVSGLPVLDAVPFGREPHSLSTEKLDLDIGCGYHMRKEITEQRICISKEELTKHTFITGSTGSGKSNTIYKLLERLDKDGVSFLVIEPAKGEYAEVLGKKEGVVTYGTNPNIPNKHLLQINPFRFPKHTHILEHLDRLVEIFNVCWPLYAAMPAILKDSVERAYVSAGWDIEKSTNKYSDNLFPTFADVVKQIKVVLSESDYSSDNKGDYTGALVTRLKSLTNGINGLIFSADDISDSELFDGNTIVDLSRVGSSETKALIMGIMVLKLQEYRMEQRALGASLNDGLKHVTVVEEAHNLLKRTSTSQSNEGANLIGKSVEMLANSIAEMRTYGEGFVIADQSPGLLDMSVIRNTNTKIILRLPDLSDRELVGKASGLTDNQIIELAKLEKGTAVISQSDWLEPVLCKIDKYNDTATFAKHKNAAHQKTKVNNWIVRKELLDCIMKKEIYRKGDRVDARKLKFDILNSNLDIAVKCGFLDYISVEDEKATASLRRLIYDFFEAEKSMEKAKGIDNIQEWSHMVAKCLSPSLEGYSKQQIDLVLALIVQEQSIRDNSYKPLLGRFAEVYKNNGGVY